MNGFSEKFESSFFDLIHRSHRVAVTVVYNKYIRDRHHVHRADLADEEKQEREIRRQIEKFFEVSFFGRDEGEGLGPVRGLCFSPSVAANSRMLFPGMWLTEVTADMYTTPEVPDTGKFCYFFFLPFISPLPNGWFRI
ncbi:hypothetical protein Tsubulata_023386 [Turnera subulata]|uniref:DNA/RNA-binding protein Kin17 WH-like domain-containing protein n=1 Tax=Turnera subulata TaxID=218843 RepID=A0A9Q0F830_9ROSI|nr:hypothetical protein Tsubulata_023386 [Turnera subulata]